MTPSATLPALLEAAFRALIAACILGAGLRLLRVRSVPVQKAAWALMLIAAFTMPLLMRWQWLPSWAAIRVPIASLSTLRQAAPAQKTVAIPSSQTAASSQSDDSTTDGLDAVAYPLAAYDAPPAATPEIAAARPAPQTTAPAQPSQKTLLERSCTAGKWLYLVVGAALLLRLILGLAASLRLWISAKPVEATVLPDDPEVMDVRWSHLVSSPVNIASGILLPAGYVDWDEEKLRVVLAHEYSHVCQRDYYMQLLAGFYTAMTWFSPLGWWLKHKLSQLSETISDHAALRAAASPADYAELLLQFAAMPRPTLTGVAMAHSTNLSKRIERFLNDSSFGQAFSSGRRALVAGVLAPALLIFATAVIRVRAAEQTAPPAPPSPPDAAAQQAPAAPPVPTQGVSRPEAAVPTAPATPRTAPNPAAEPKPAPAPENGATPAPMAPAQPRLNGKMKTPLAPAAPMVPPLDIQVHVPAIPTIAMLYGQDRPLYLFTDGNPYAIVGDPDSKTHFFGSWDVDRNAEVEKARKITQGHFLLFRHDGKTYMIDDPETMARIDEMEKSLDSLNMQMRGMSKQIRQADEQVREAARKARETANAIPTPDITKEMAELDAAVANLKAAQGGTVTRQQLQEIQRKLNEVQRQLMRSEIRINVDLSGPMGQLGKEQGEIGKQMGQLGAQIGTTARENFRKTQDIIDQSLKEGKARQVN